MENLEFFHADENSLQLHYGERPDMKAVMQHTMGNLLHHAGVELLFAAPNSKIGGFDISLSFTIPEIHVNEARQGTLIANPTKAFQPSENFIKAVERVGGTVSVGSLGILIETPNPLPAQPEKHPLKGYTWQEIMQFYHDNVHNQDSRQYKKVHRYMRSVADRILADPWKNPVHIYSPEIPDEWVKACIVFYHGIEPTEEEGKHTFFSPGYQCW